MHFVNGPTESSKLPISAHLPVARAYWVVPEVNPRRASLRYRCLYPLGELQRRGLLASIYRHGDSYTVGTPFVFDAWQLFPTVSHVGKADELLNFARMLKAANAKIVVDNCDNQFSAQSDSLGWRAGLERLRQLGAIADVMVCCSTALADALKTQISGAARYCVIDDPIEEKITYPGESKFKRLISPAENSARIKRMILACKIKFLKTSEKRNPLVWYGSHGNQFSPGGMLDILTLRGVLERVNAVYPLSLTIISNHRTKFQDNFSDWDFPVLYLEWDRANFLQALTLHDISILPIEENPFTQCKSSNRLTLSIHHGIVPVASSVPSYLQFSDLVRLGNWEENLLELLGDRAVRQSELKNAQMAIHRSHCLTAISDEWQQLLFNERN